MAEEEWEVAIAGAGIAGLAAAVALKKVGLKSMVVLEKADEIRATGAGIMVFPNAWRALSSLGVAKKLVPFYSSIASARMTNILTGAYKDVHFRGNSSIGWEMGARAVDRKALLKALADELPADTIRFSSKLKYIVSEPSTENKPPISVLHLEDGTVIRAKVLIGCDGVHSSVARWLGLSDPVPAGRSAVRGLAVYREGHGLKHVLQHFLGDGKRVGYSAVNDKEVYWFSVHWSTHGEEEAVKTKDPAHILKDVLENIAKEFPPEFLDIVRHSNLSTVSWAPLVLRQPWDLLTKQAHKGNVFVAGDAMHPMTPDLGQGGCLALEDGVVIGRKISGCLDSEGAIVASKVGEGIAEYVKERRWRAARLITWAYVFGWVQQGGYGWWGCVVRFLRDNMLHKFLYPKLADVAKYDCGDLPN